MPTPSDPSGIRFDSEGGFTTPNGFHVPAEPTRKKHYTAAQLARLAGQHRWGWDRPDDGDVDSLLKFAEQEHKFSHLDAGNLQRIADGIEKLTAGPLMDLLTAALEPLLQMTVARRQRWFERQRQIAESLVATVETRCGPCPAPLRKAILHDVLRWARVRRDQSCVVERRQWLPDSDPYIFNPRRHDVVKDRIYPVGKKGSKLRRQYDAWRRRRVKPQPEPEAQT